MPLWQSLEGEELEFGDATVFLGVTHSSDKRSPFSLNFKNEQAKLVQLSPLIGGVPDIRFFDRPTCKILRLKGHNREDLDKYQPAS